MRRPGNAKTDQLEPPAPKAGNTRDAGAMPNRRTKPKQEKAPPPPAKDGAGGAGQPGDNTSADPRMGREKIEVPDASAETAEVVDKVTGSLFGRRVNLSHQRVIRIAIAVVIVVFAVVMNRSFLAWGLFSVLAVLFLPVHRFRAFIIAFVPYASIWSIFTFFRSFADETPLATMTNLYVLHFERFLFDGQIPTITLQTRFYDPEHLHWWDYYFTFTHWSYFIIPHLVALRLWQKYPDVFKRYMAAITILLTIGLAIYFLIPTNPPWLSDDSTTAAAPTVSRVMENVARHVGGGLYQASYKVIGESNPIAAMPSLHLGVTWLLLFPLGRFGRAWRLLGIYYGLSMATGLIYLGEHYFTDCVVGAAVASYAWWASGAWIREVAPRISHLTRTNRRPEPAAGAPT